MTHKMSSTTMTLAAFICALLLAVTSATLRELVVSDDGEEVVEAISNSAEGFVRVKRSVTREKRATDENKGSVTFDERLVFLRKHNDYRRGVSPAAANMRFMVWHPELASMAQEWANKCDFKHGQPPRDPKPWNQIGQNLWAGTGGFDAAGSTKAWYDEVVDYTYDTVACKTGKVCGHYTQVVWHKSSNVGCGIKYCSNMKSFSQGKGYLIVCNYGPAGNYAGAKPYTKGASCSACPSEFPKCDNKLCTPTVKCGSKTCAKGSLNADCECPDDPGVGNTAAQQALPAQVTCFLSLALALVAVCTCAW